MSRDALFEQERDLELCLFSPLLWAAAPLEVPMVIITEA